MNNRFFFPTLPIGMRCFILIYALTLPLVLSIQFGVFPGLSVVYKWLSLTPALIWKGQLWRLVTYAFLPASIVDWAVSLFWLGTLVLVLGRNWSSLGFWAYCLIGALGGALPVVLAFPGMERGFVGNVAVIFALLVAWDRLYRRERILMLGFGEVSVRQAAIVVAIINVLILFFCAGWFLTLSMLCGGVVGWLYLMIGQRRLLSRDSQVTNSERMARLEL